MKKKMLNISIVILIILICSGIVGYHFVVKEDEDDGKKETKILIEKVEILPEIPQSNETIEIVAYVNQKISSRYINFDYVTLYNGGTKSGGFPMKKNNDENYYAEIGPFEDNIEIWIIISISKSDDIVIYEDTIEIGDIEYTDNITIENVEYEPKDLSECSSIKITADFYHYEVIKQYNHMIGIYFIFQPNSQKTSGSSTLSSHWDRNTGASTYSMTISNNKNFPIGTVILYRLFYTGDYYRLTTPVQTITIP